MDYRAVLSRFIDELWNAGNLGIVDELMHADCVVHSSITGLQRGRAAVKDGVTRLTLAFPDFRLAVHEVIVEGETAVARSTARGAYRGPASPAGAAPFGREFAAPWVIIARFRDGLIAESWVIWDTLVMLQQIGVIPRDTGATDG